MTPTIGSARSDALLRCAIRLDGVLIGVSGIVLLLAADPLARTLGVPASNLYWIGAANTVYLLVAFILAGLRSIGISGLLTVAANLASAAALLVRLVSPAGQPTAFGVALEVVATAYCLAIGGLQCAGFLRLPQGRRLRALPVPPETTAS